MNDNIIWNYLWPSTNRSVVSNPVRSNSPSLKYEAKIKRILNAAQPHCRTQQVGQTNNNIRIGIFWRPRESGCVTLETNRAQTTSPKTSTWRPPLPQELSKSTKKIMNLQQRNTNHICVNCTNNVSDSFYSYDFVECKYCANFVIYIIYCVNWLYFFFAVNWWEFFEYHLI